MYPQADSNAAPRSQAPARIVVVGAGALGCAAARTLTQNSHDSRSSAIPGLEILLVDDDRVELSNLQRQVLYGEGDIGAQKVDAAAARLLRDFGVKTLTAATRMDESNGPALLAGASIVIDGTDDPATKFLIARLAREAGLPSVYGGVARTGGNWMLTVPGVSACLECVFPSRADAAEPAAGCSALGILAPVAGVVGTMQALMTIAFLKRPQRAVAGRLHVYELTGARSRHIDFPPSADCPCGAAGRSGQQQARREGVHATN